MKEGRKLIAVLPAYNAEKTLELTLADIPKDLFDRVILVDDCSRDGTVALARRLGLKVIVHEKNLGYGGNQKTCYREALADGADIVVMIHPDYQYDPTLAPDLVAPILEGRADCVLGSRMMRDEALKGKMPLWKYIGNKMLTGIENLVFRQKYSEYHTGYRAYSRKVLETLQLELNSDGFVFDQQIIAQMLAAGFRIAEVPIPTRYFKEASSVSFLVSVKYGLQTIGTLAQYFMHTRLGIRFRKFTTLGLLLALLGAAVSEPARADGLFIVDTQDQWMQGSGEFVDYWSNPGSIRPYRPAASDYFESSTLSPSWTWSPCGILDDYSLLDGKLTLTCTGGSEWNGVTSCAPRLFQIVRGDSFSISVHLQDDRPSHLSGFAGLYLGKDSLNWIEIGISEGTDGGSPDKTIHTRKYENGSLIYDEREVPLINPVYLKIERSGNSVATYFRSPSTTLWTSGANLSSDYDHFEVGIYCKDTESDSFVVFDDFLVSGTDLPPDEVSYLSRVFDFGSSPKTEGSFSWDGDIVGGGTFSFATRTSDDNALWDDWISLAASGSSIKNVARRYLQFKVSMTRSGFSFLEVDFAQIYYPPEPVYGEVSITEERVRAVPHPIRDRIATIQYDVLAPVSEVVFEFINQGGRRVQQLTAAPQVGSNQMNWDTSGLPNGLYFLKITARAADGKTTCVTKKLAIVR